MADPSVVDHLTRLRLKLLEKRLENEQDNLEKMELSLQAARNRPQDMLQNALRQRKDLLQELREQHLLEELSQPPAPAGGHCHDHRAALPQVYEIPFPASQVEPPRIIQQTMPTQPATIIQQLPQPSPLITQIPPAQTFAAPRSGSIKEDMVEMMLMQNAQMHQVMMQNMMLKALPPTAFTQLGGGSSALLQHPQQVKTPQPEGLLSLGGHKAWTEHTKRARGLWRTLRKGDTGRACPDSHLPLQAILSFCISLTLTNGINWGGVGSQY
uniref:Chromosome 21 open reading frame 58 n=1 Tax=Cyanoderma ruficeps TaxID=181631 RepID=A0A8C3NQD2_9PASS